MPLIVRPELLEAKRRSILSTLALFGKSTRVTKEITDCIVLLFSPLEVDHGAGVPSGQLRGDKA
jgi:hypothetical protein